MNGLIRSGCYEQMNLRQKKIFEGRKPFFNSFFLHFNRQSHHPEEDKSSTSAPV